MRYLLVKYVKRPNGQMDEEVTVAKNLKQRDIQYSAVILDFKEQKVLKAALRDNAIPKDWERIVGYYYPFYTKIMERLFEENGHALPQALRWRRIHQSQQTRDERNQQGAFQMPVHPTV